MARICILSNRVSIPSTGRAVHPGGLEVALRALLKEHRCVWMGWSGKAVDDPSEVMVHRSSAAGTDYIVTDLNSRDFEEYYNGFANRVLWPVLHYRQDLAEFSRRDLSGYLRVNDRFADLLIQNLEPGDVVWVHDYHLMPLARVLRARGFTNRIGFFLHIPMPPPEVVAAMPHHDQVLGALAEYDLVGFQTETDTVNFARYIAQQFGSSPHLGTIPSGLRVGTFPVGIETAEFHRMAQVGQGQETVCRLAQTGLDLVVGVDRLDYSKGLGLKFEAFEQVLKAKPEWRGRVTLLQITPKSRSAIAEYAAMEQELDTLSGRINADYGDVLWQPIRFVTKAYGRDQLAGIFRIARVGVVTPLRDGMNLVAKEYVAAQNPADPGVLVLSQFAGAAAELRAALLVNPNDPEAVSQAIIDMDFHTAALENSDPVTMQKASLAAIGMPDEIAPRHAGTHFGHVFAGEGYSAGYYSYLWSEVLDADGFGAFTEAKDPFAPEVAKRLYEHIYASGGTRDFADAYREFRGRDPELAALLKGRGLESG